jgi:hypothetical protein
MENLLAIFILLVSLPVHADVYRWTDANGKVHFGDKKPGAKAENITEMVKQTNIDTSANEHQKLETLFRKENPDDSEQQQAQSNTAQLQHCAEAKVFLNKISGRLQVIDDNGKPVHISESERQQRAKELRKAIKENCPT